MKITCNRTELLNSITGVGRAVSGKTSIPAIEGILFQCDETKLKLSAYDLEIGIITYVEVQVDEPGDIVINARLLGEILRKSEGEQVTISTDENLKVDIVSGITKYSFVGIPASDFPELPIPTAESTLTIPGQDLQELISRTIYAVSTNDQKPVHTGSKFVLRDNELTVASVDGHRLAVARKSGIKEDLDISFIVPAKTLNEVCKLIGDREENVRIGTARRYAVFNLVGYTVVTRLLEGDFIDFNKSIPTVNKTCVRVKASSLIDSVERVSTIINDRFKNPIRLRFEDDLIKISCSTAMGSVYDEIACETEGDTVEIGFNYRYLLDALRNAGTDEVKFFINEVTMPMTMRPAEGDDFVYLILPVRLR